MQIIPSRTGAQGTRLTGEIPREALDIGDDDFARPAGPICYDVKARAVCDQLIVQGRLSATIRFRCSRCDEFFEQTVTEPAYECVRRITDPDQAVDLTGDAREAMILAFPNYPVCSKGCRGLCSKCGAELNRKQCDCTPDGNGQWEALDSLAGRL